MAFLERLIGKGIGTLQMLKMVSLPLIPGSGELNKVFRSIDIIEMIPCRFDKQSRVRSQFRHQPAIRTFNTGNFYPFYFLEPFEQLVAGFHSRRRPDGWKRPTSALGR